MRWPWSKECSNCKQVQDGMTRLTSLDYKASEVDPMVINAAFDGAAVKLFAAAAAHWFRETGATNFVVLEMNDPRTGERFELTMQRAGGKTPAERIGELEEQLGIAR